MVLGASRLYAKEKKEKRTGKGERKGGPGTTSLVQSKEGAMKGERKAGHL